MATARDDAGDPILLVHGYMDTKHAPWWSRLERQLAAAADAPAVRTLDQGSMPLSTVGSPRAYADRIAGAVRELAAAFDGRVDVLAHSMGGLSARWYVEHCGGDRHVDDLVTLGTPHRGTALAYLGAGTPGGRAMVPGSAFLDELNAGGLSASVDYAAVWSDGDRMIDPAKSAALDPSWFPSMRSARNVRLEDASHMGLVSEPDLVDRYAALLE